MIFSKKFQVNKNVDTEEAIISFWENRNMKIIRKSETCFEGKRGSLVGNLLSYDMGKLITKLSIKINEDNEINSELIPNTIGQYITKWNKEYWKLELDTFESVLLNNDYKEDEWVEYKKSIRGKNMLWTVGSFIMGVASALVIIHIMR